MRPRKTQPSGSGDLFRARLDQVINTDHELVRLARKIGWEWIDGEPAARFSDKGRPATERLARSARRCSRVIGARPGRRSLASGGQIRRSSRACPAVA
jgi:hypothetical protein